MLTSGACAGIYPQYCGFGSYKDAPGFLSLSSYVVRQASARFLVLLWLCNTTSGWGEQPW